MLILADATQEGNPYQTVIMLLIGVAFFYFILWRPEQMRRKKMKSLRDTMKPGDKVTAMGIVGTVESVTEKTVILKNVDGSKVEMIKAAVSEIHPAEEQSQEQAPPPPADQHS